MSHICRTSHANDLYEVSYQCGFSGVEQRWKRNKSLPKSFTIETFFTSMNFLVLCKVSTHLKGLSVAPKHHTSKAIKAAEGSSFPFYPKVKMRCPHPPNLGAVKNGGSCQNGSLGTKLPFMVPHSPTPSICFFCSFCCFFSSCLLPMKESKQAANLMKENFWRAHDAEEGI